MVMIQKKGFIYILQLNWGGHRIFHSLQSSRVFIHYRYHCICYPRSLFKIYVYFNLNVQTCSQISELNRNITQRILHLRFRIAYYLYAHYRLRILTFTTDYMNYIIFKSFAGTHRYYHSDFVRSVCNNRYTYMSLDSFVIIIILHFK